ncbi:N-acetyltransferase [Solwaraspora sp. WMMD1047]|uniref:GNAT family N-acetyltransferase n=1 Tax=Solwaraspora sp. WMMD1047 TaxID=3016102 RepID=UPI002417D4EA|nr:GNAT family N-acetyltransferase [Solwaraspora sp. WMMD1047]MDG4834506.1 N-acetyltransferase [Solwaraspora sp. WMMD1047]
MEQPLGSTPDRPTATRATPADRAAVVDTVVAAFATDPAFRYFFPTDADYRRQAPIFAGYLFDRRVGGGSVWIVEGGASVAMWEPPATPAADVALDLPAEVTDRLTAFDRPVRAALPATPFWYLGILATHPAHAGRRWGREVMTAGLREAAAAGLPAYLETATERNVGIYRRAGWRVTAELTSGGLPVWVLAHG